MNYDTIKNALASVPESGALTVTPDEAQAIRKEYNHIVGQEENAFRNEGMQKAIATVLAHRPTPAPALCHCYVDGPPHTHGPLSESAPILPCPVCGNIDPTPRQSCIPEPAPQDDAAVVGAARIEYRETAGFYAHPQALRAVIKLVRRGMVPLEAVEKAIREQWVVPIPQDVDAWTAGVLARLTAVPKPPSKQGRVDVFHVGSKVNNLHQDRVWCVLVNNDPDHPKTCYRLREDVALAYGEKVRQELEKGASHE